MLSKAVGLSSANSAQSTSLCQALSTACYSHHLTQPCTLVINISRAVTKTLRSREVRWSHLGLTSRIHILLSNSEACAPGPLWPWRQPPPLLQPSSLPPHPPSWGKYVLSVLPLSPKPSHPDSLGVACLMCGVLILACWHLLSCPWNSILTPVRNHFSPPVPLCPDFCLNYFKRYNCLSTLTLVSTYPHRAFKNDVIQTYSKGLWVRLFT